MMNSTIIILLCLLFTGCIRNIDKQAYELTLTQADEDALWKSCREIDQIGNLSEYMRLIKLETDLMLELIDNLEIHDSAAEVIELNDSIAENINEARKLIDVSYTTPQWQYQVKWRVDRKDFKGLIGNYLPKGFKIQSIRPVTARLFGEEADHLLSGLKYAQKGKSIEFTYAGLGSSLEICQLQKTRMIVVEVSYRNVVNHNKRIFNLINR